MAKKTTPRAAGRTVRQAASRAAAAAQAGHMSEAWKATMDAYTAAEAELERQIRDLVKKGKVNAREASQMAKDLQSRFQKERKKAVKELDSRLKGLQHRVEKERKVVTRMVDDAVRAALAAFNIPSRSEVAELTRKVDELSRKIDSIKRAPRRTSGRRVTVASTAASV